jgi:hypothetical protein
VRWCASRSMRRGAPSSRGSSPASPPARGGPCTAAASCQERGCRTTSPCRRCPRAVRRCPSSRLPDRRGRHAARDREQAEHSPRVGVSAAGDSRTLSGIALEIGHRSSFIAAALRSVSSVMYVDLILGSPTPDVETASSRSPRRGMPSRPQARRRTGARVPPRALPGPSLREAGRRVRAKPQGRHAGHGHGNPSAAPTTAHAGWRNYGTGAASPSRSCPQIAGASWRTAALLAGPAVPVRLRDVRRRSAGTWVPAGERR